MDNQDNQNEVIYKVQQKLKQWIYYLIVFGLSMTVMIVFPMLNMGNDVPTLNLPVNVAGWIEYVSIRAAISGINLFIYTCFVQQGKLNVVNNPNYIEANKLLDKVKVKEYKPRSPSKFKAKQYGGKSIGILFSSALALVAFPPIIAYDWQMAIVYLLTIAIAVFFGIYQMKVTEVYWSEEYLEWAKYKLDKEAAAEKAEETYKLDKEAAAEKAEETYKLDKEAAAEKAEETNSLEMEDKNA